jgi:hypothetical protein
VLSTVPGRSLHDIHVLTCQCLNVRTLGMISLLPRRRATCRRRCRCFRVRRWVIRQQLLRAEHSTNRRPQAPRHLTTVRPDHTTPHQTRPGHSIADSIALRYTRQPAFDYSRVCVCHGSVRIASAFLCMRVHILCLRRLCSLCNAQRVCVCHGSPGAGARTWRRCCQSQGQIAARIPT